MGSFSYSVDGEVGNGGAISISSGGINRVNGDLLTFSVSRSKEAGDGGDINLSSSRSISGNDTQLNTVSLAQTSGQESGEAGNINFDGEDARVSGFEIVTVSSADRSGTVRFSGIDSILVEDTRVTTSAQAEIEDPLLEQTITLDTSGFGQSGDALFTSMRGNLRFTNVEVQSDANGGEPAGNITINSPGQITFISSRIDSNTNSAGAAGSFEVTAKEGIEIQGLTESGNRSGIFARTNAGGQGGNITLNTPRLTLANTSSIQATTSSGARGGTLTLNAPEDSLEISGKGQIEVDTSGEGRAGDLIINVPTVSIDETQLSAATNGPGQGGEVTLNLSQLTLSKDAQISASTTGNGQGGNFNISTQDPLTIKGNGQLRVETEANGQQGNISISTPILNILDKIRISATATETATLPQQLEFPNQGGNINLIHLET